MPTPPRPQGYWAEALERTTTGRSWPFYAVLHAWLAYWALRYSLDPAFSTLIDAFLMPVHEAGHPLFRPLGHFMGALGGSLTQWGFPLFVTLGFLKRRDLYAACLGVFFLGVALNMSCCYMDSSFQMEKYPDMVFVSLGDGEAEHDWQAVFGALGWYRGYTTVALLTRAAGLTLMWGSLAAGASLLWRMAVGGDER